MIGKCECTILSNASTLVLRAFEEQSKVSLSHLKHLPLEKRKRAHQELCIVVTSQEQLLRRDPLLLKALELQRNQ